MDNVEYTEYGMEEDVSSMQTKVSDFFKKNLYEIAVVLVCFVRVIVGISDVQLSGKTVIEIIGDSILTIVFAILLARMLEEKGLAVGEQGKNHQHAMAAYREVEKRAGKHIKAMDEWCETYSRTEYENTITTMLYPLGISYEQYLKGEYDESRFSKSQRHQLHKVKRMKMYVYTTEELMSGDLDPEKNSKRMKVSKKKYRRRSAVADFGSKVVLSVVFGLLTLPPLVAWNWSGVIWKLFETVVMLAFAVVKYFNAYTFVDEDLTAKVICKTMLLNKFLENVESREILRFAQNDSGADKDGIAASQAERNDVAAEKEGILPYGTLDESRYSVASSLQNDRKGGKNDGVAAENEGILHCVQNDRKNARNDGAAQEIIEKEKENDRILRTTATGGE